MNAVPNITISAATLQTAPHSWMAVPDVKDIFFVVSSQEDKEEFTFTLEEMHL